MQDFERYLKIQHVFGVSFGPEGQLSILWDVTGVPQVWTLEEPRTWPRQRTFYDERIRFATWSPERPELIFGMDDEGNERTQLFRLAVRDGSITPLTERPEAKHRWGGWSRDGEQFAFTSNRRDGSAFDVYVQPRDGSGSDARRVFEGEGHLKASGWGPEDDRLIVTRSYSSFDQELAVLDVDSGTLTPVASPRERVHFSNAQWGPDGDALYLVTDFDANRRYLARLDVTDASRPLSERLVRLRDGGRWNVGGMALHEETGRIVYSRNVDGYSRLTVETVEGTTIAGSVPTPEFPGNVVTDVSFGPDGERFAALVTGRRQNVNVVVVDVETGEGTQWTAASTAGLPRSSFVEPELVRYTSFDGLEVPAFVSLPDDYDPGGTPAIVDVHGGPESQRRPAFNTLPQYFLARGYAYMEPNVRGSTGYGRRYASLDDVERRMDAVDDLDAAAAWLADHEAIDPDRIAIVGGSYGGFMALAALTRHPDRWAAGVAVAGIGNFVTFLENTSPWRREHREAEYGSLESDRELLEAISPINHMDNVSAPLFVVHGENDPRVPVDEAKQIVETATEQDVPVDSLFFEDEGHNVTKPENKTKTYTRIADFLDEHV